MLQYTICGFIQNSQLFAYIFTHALRRRVAHIKMGYKLAYTYVCCSKNVSSWKISNLVGKLEEQGMHLLWHSTFLILICLLREFLKNIALNVTTPGYGCTRNLGNSFIYNKLSKSGIESAYWPLRQSPTITGHLYIVHVINCERNRNALRDWEV